MLLKNFRFYIAFSKNIRATQFMNSVSTYLPAGLGGINGSKIENDQIIDFVEVGPKILRIIFQTNIMMISQHQSLVVKGRV